MSAIPISFAFDPLCPWCWQTSKWIRRVEELGEAEVTWGVYSLELAHHDDGVAAGDPLTSGVRGLRTAIAVRDKHGNDAMGAFYAALGTRYFEKLEPYEDAATFHRALEDIGLAPGRQAQAAGPRRAHCNKKTSNSGNVQPHTRDAGGWPQTI